MRYLSCIDIAKAMKKWERERFLIGGTSVRPSDILQKVVYNLKAKNVVEIGTGFGTASIAIASCDTIKKLITFDVKDSIWPGYLAEKFGLTDKIEFIHARNSQEIYDIIKKYKFDFAYIDGSHKPPFVEDDFNAVKNTGRVLFDDANSIHVKKVLEANQGKMIGNRFGYWCNDKNYYIVEKIKSKLVWDETPAGEGKLNYSYEYLNSI